MKYGQRRWLRNKIALRRAEPAHRVLAGMVAQKREEGLAMAKGQKSVTVKMMREKETKNSVRFQEVAKEGQAPVIGTLYLQKWWIGDTIEIDVEVRNFAKP
jgi:hypothetical protein